jgi:hypothetical protein
MNRILEGNPLIIFGSMISPQIFAQTEGQIAGEGGGRTKRDR